MLIESVLALHVLPAINYHTIRNSLSLSEVIYIAFVVFIYVKSFYMIDFIEVIHVFGMMLHGWLQLMLGVDMGSLICSTDF